MARASVLVVAAEHVGPIRGEGAPAPRPRVVPRIGFNNLTHWKTK
jgi:hypothetical protein